MEVKIIISERYMHVLGENIFEVHLVTEEGLEVDLGIKGENDYDVLRQLGERLRGLR